MKYLLILITLAAMACNEQVKENSGYPSGFILPDSPQFKFPCSGCVVIDNAGNRVYPKDTSGQFTGDGIIRYDSTLCIISIDTTTVSSCDYSMPPGFELLTNEKGHYIIRDWSGKYLEFSPYRTRPLALELEDYKDITVFYDSCDAKEAMCKYYEGYKEFKKFHPVK